MKKFKRILALAIAAIMLMSLASCSLVDENSTDITNDNIKVGVLLSDTKDASTGMAGTANAAINELTSIGYGINGERFKYAESVNPDDADAVAAALKSLVNFECSLVIATDSAYLDDIQKITSENPNVKFLVFNVDGDGKSIYGYDANIAEAAYLSGMVAGLKAAELKVPQLGFLAKSEDDLSVLNAFAMGAKAANADAVVSAIISTDAAADTAKLIKEGCVVIASDFESEALAKTATEADVFFCGFSSETFSRDTEEVKYSESFLCAPIYNFTQFYIAAIKAIVDSYEPSEFTGGYATGAVAITDLNEGAVADGTQEIVSKAANAIASGEIVLADSDATFENVTIVK